MECARVSTAMALASVELSLHQAAIEGFEIGVDLIFCYKFKHHGYFCDMQGFVFNSLRPRRFFFHFCGVFLQTTFSVSFLCVKISTLWLKSHRGLLLRVHLTIYNKPALIQKMAWHWTGYSHCLYQHDPVYWCMHVSIDLFHNNFSPSR